MQLFWIKLQCQSQNLLSYLHTGVKSEIMHSRARKTVRVENDSGCKNSHRYLKEALKVLINPTFYNTDYSTRYFDSQSLAG